MDEEGDGIDDEQDPETTLFIQQGSWDDGAVYYVAFLDGGDEVGVVSTCSVGTGFSFAGQAIRSTCRSACQRATTTG